MDEDIYEEWNEIELPDGSTLAWYDWCPPPDKLLDQFKSGKRKRIKRSPSHDLVRGVESHAGE